MIDISVQGIKKAFEEGNDILDGITFDINEGECVGLLGKNGAGKTTLLKIITGELFEDEGEIVIPENKKIGLISQIPVFSPEFTGEDVLRTAFSRLFTIKTEMEQLEERMSKGDSSEILDDYDRLSHEYQRSGGYTIESELNRVVNGLQIPHAHREQSFHTLSGGEKTRINLARLILENTDILLLDEPTNHLDLNATIWLEEFLAKFKGTALVISHDRYFLDKTINRAIEIKSGKAEFYSGNYSYYVGEKQRRYDEQFTKYKREQAESKRLHASADRLQLWGFGNSQLMKKSFAVRTRAERAIKTDRPDRDKTMRAKFAEREFRGDEVLMVKGLKKSYNQKKLIDIDELLVKGRERIAIIGDNGTGKTTLIKIIMGEEKPDSGFVRLGPSVKTAYLPQIIHFDHPHRSILDTLIYEQNESPQTARNRLGAYLFSGEDVYKQVGDLSGGEKSRLRLCMLLSGEINLLILDEPTNHLDLASREWIESAALGYDETLMFISHDRYFINRFATRIWVLEDGSFTDFKGTYEEYTAMRSSSASNLHNSLQGKIQGKSQSKLEMLKTQQKIKPADAQKELRRVERDIEKLEAELRNIEIYRAKHSSDYEKLMELDEQELVLKAELDSLLDEWEEAVALTVQN
ncbi:MAG: ABC-F family ATP-binding cassette domain-containing protein [Oscillospiraceae bacterium]|jgi:ATPase subunit of ABC transporter with duplicated ATPase domains|nr:ABC-F family ATP-binding cassette domain-containing protein [Oscillospiraceae bacterium]